MKILRYGQAIEKLGDRYNLEGMLGSGGMADVCLAWDEVEQHDVAIKLLKPDGLDQETLNRFVKEAGQIVGWQHPHVLRIYDHVQVEVIKHANQESMLFYIVMEYANGGDLQKRMKSGEPYYSLTRAFTIFRQICGSVQYAHKHGIIHRDLKPLNILFRKPRTGPEEAVLSDFGLAVQVDASHHTFARAGTLSYMAPEQFHGLSEPASDIFALGVILYQLLTGFLPYQRSLKDLALFDIDNEPEPLSPNVLNPALPEILNDPVLWALSPRPEERYRTAQEFWNTIALALSQSVLPSERGIRSPQPQPSAAQLSEDGRTIREDSHVPKANAPVPNPTPIKNPKPVVTASGSVTRHIDPQIIQLSNAQVPDPPKKGKNQPPPFSPSAARATTRHTMDLIGHIPWRSFPHRNILLSTVAIFLLLLLTFVLIGPLHLFAVSTTVTLTPRSQTVQGNYQLVAVTGTPDAAQHQIQATLLTATATQQQATGSVTGTIPGTKAKGQLTFINNGSTDVTVPTMIFRGKSGVAITFQGPIVVTAIPASITVDAIAVDAGAAGNIDAFDILEYCCAPGTQIQVRNATKFTGGADAQQNGTVQQSDINNAANALVASQTQAQQQKLAPQVKSNERVVDGSAKCTPTINADHAVGDAATSVTVQVSVACSEDVYDSIAAQATANSLLTDQAAKDPGTAYKLSRHTTVSVSSSSVTQDGKQAQITVKASGKWVYAFSATMLHQFALQIAGKSFSDAHTFLLQQSGIANAEFSSTSTLPGNSNNIIFVVKNQ